MKTVRFLTILLMLIGMDPEVLYSQDNLLQIGGKLQTDQRVLTHDDYAWTWNENRLALDLEKRLHEQAKFYTLVWVRSFGFPGLTNAGQLSSKDLTSPYSFELREAYIDLYGFLFKNLDLRLGRQRIAWGTGDKLNPTNNLDPMDLEDIWDFGRHHASDAIKITYYLDNFRIEGVYLPFFRPATLPMGDVASVLTQEVSLPQGLILRNFSDTLIMPENTLTKSGGIGAKFAGIFLGYDFSLSYTKTKWGLPVASYNKITPVDIQGRVDVETRLIYPEINVVGADLSGSVGSIGVWFEGALFIPPEKVLMSTDMSEMGFQIMDSVILEKNPFFKYLFGTDYTFKNGTYLNFQFLHGFFHEMGKGHLNDYFTFNIEKKFLKDQFKITPLSGALIVSDWKNVQNNFAVIFNPSICYSPNDNTEITLGIRLIEGKGENSFVMLKDRDELFFKIVYSF